MLLSGKITIYNLPIIAYKILIKAFKLTHHLMR